MDLSGQEFGQSIVGMTCLLHVSSSAGQTQRLSVANWALGDLECSLTCLARCLGELKDEDWTGTSVSGLSTCFGLPHQS